jgi:hypothetical protein
MINVFITKPSRALLVASIALTIFSANAQAPHAKTQVAGPVRATTATLNGMAVPRGTVTTAWFEWGTDRTYGSSTSPQNIGNGIRVVRVSESLAGLIEGEVYHFRLVASNSFGVTRGFGFMFTTGMKIQNWGSYLAGLPTVPAGLTNLSGIACGHRHALAIRNDGTVAAWSCATVGIDFGETVVPEGLSNVVAVAGASFYSLALKEDGSVVAWGKFNSSASASPPATLSNVIAISAGDRFGVALRADGTLKAWGTDTAGTNVPPSATNVVAISCGSFHALALKADGSAIAWGMFGASHQPPSSVTNLIAVNTMASWNLGLREDGTVLEWGLAYSTDVPKPPNLTNVVAIATGYSYAEVLRADGTLIGWGSAAEATNIPPTLSNVVSFASGDYHRIALAPVNLGPKAFPRSLPGGTNQPLTISLLPGS